MLPHLHSHPQVLFRSVKSARPKHPAAGTGKPNHVLRGPYGHKQHRSARMPQGRQAGNWQAWTGTKVSSSLSWSLGHEHASPLTWNDKESPLFHLLFEEMLSRGWRPVFQQATCNRRMLLSFKFLITQTLGQHSDLQHCISSRNCLIGSQRHPVKEFMGHLLQAFQVIQLLPVRVHPRRQEWLGNRTTICAGLTVTWGPEQNASVETWEMKAQGTLRWPCRCPWKGSWH